MVEVISAKDAAEILGYSRQYVTKLIREGKLSGKRIGLQWAVDKDSVLRYKAEREAEKAANRGKTTAED